MAYNSSHTGAQIDAAVSAVRQKESVWDAKETPSGAQQKADAAEAAAIAASDPAGSAAEVQDNLDSLESTVSSHTGNSSIHVTSSDKQNWNSKAPGSLSETVSSLSDSLDSLESTVSGHTGNSTIHVTSSDKSNWNSKAPGSLSTTVSNLEYDLNSHTGNSGIHVTEEEKVYRLSHSKSGNIHYLTGLSGAPSGIYSCIFRAVDSYSAGDTIRVDGYTYSVMMQDGSAAPDNLFVAGNSVAVVIDKGNQYVNFKAAGGGAKLPAETTAIVAIFTANGTWTVPQDGKYRVTVIGAGGSGRAAVNRGYSSGGHYAGGGGGAGGAAQSELELSKNESYAITVSTSKSSFGSLLTATVGAAPSSSSSSSYLGGSGGTASGGNLWNEKGGDGGDGEHGTTSMDYSGGDGGSYTRTNKFIGPASGAAGNSVDCGQAPSVPTSGGFFPYGGGCSGGASEDPSGTNEDYLHNGGTGSRGAVIIEIVLE